MSEHDDMGAAAPGQPDKVMVELGTPIQAHGDEMHLLHFRKPTGADIAACGYPLKFTAEGESTFIAGPMERMIKELAGIPLSSVRALSAADWQECAGAIMPFFGKAGSTS